MKTSAWIPRATYRLQFNRDFRFADATALVPYLVQLGVSHCYASPYLKARPGSSHGYDIVDHGALNPEIGDAAEFEEFSAALAAAGMGQMLDIVPNHMGVGSDNSWWLEVLENGRASRYANFFDIDWQPLRDSLRGKVLLPVLGDNYGSVLERGELKLIFDAAQGAFSLHYYEQFFPLDPRSYPAILNLPAASAPDLLAAQSEQDVALLELQSLATAFGHLPPQEETRAEKIAERERDKEIHKQRLADLCARAPAILTRIQERVENMNGEPGDSASFDALHELIKAQAFHLAYWRVAADDINYRRFFDIKELAGLRMERPEVFEATHRLILDWVGQGKIHALRIDHPDGLYDPLQYFTRLQSGLRERLGNSNSTELRPFYLVIEKIVASFEHLPDCWPIHGTTGYHFANLVNGVFVDRQGEELLTRAYAHFIHEHMVYDEVLYRAKKLIMKVTLASELNVLVGELGRIAQASRQTCDFTLHSLRDALMEVVACFPVYRTYITPSTITEEDRAYIEAAVAAARTHVQAADLSVFDFVGACMLTDIAAGKGEGYQKSVLNFAMNMQQFTSPVMAKGMEDTSFYIYNRLCSLNEVGGDPRLFGYSVAEFHTANLDRAQRWPYTLLATSTHDSKRSEDVRARINVLSEVGAAWHEYLSRWSRMNAKLRPQVDGLCVPHPNDEYLLYQTLIGVWPSTPPNAQALQLLCQRVQSYMLKVVREAKTFSSWINPNLAYEQGLNDFIAALFDPRVSRRFHKSFYPFQKRVAWCGMLNSLAQTILKLSVPGVPDIYQGNELWDFSLVDPDNRRPVNYRQRQALLEEMMRSDCDEGTLRTLFASMSDGRIKLYMTWRLLDFRRRYEDLMRDGAYLPLAVEGAHARQICAFARQGEDQCVVVIVSRLLCGMGLQAGALPVAEMWGETWVKTPMLKEQTRGQDIFSRRVLSLKRPGGPMADAGISVRAAFAVAPFAVLDFSKRLAA